MGSKRAGGKTIAVVGGGPSGCEAARVLALRGFHVTLFEKSAKLGGQVKLASVPPHKFRFRWLYEYYETVLRGLGVEIQTNTEATVPPAASALAGSRLSGHGQRARAVLG